MSVHTEQKTARPRGLWGAFRALWQRRPNVVPAEAISVDVAHELANDGRIVPPTSDQRPVDSAQHQRLSFYAAERFMVQECYVAPKTKNNSIAGDLTAMNRFIAQDRATAEAPIPHADIDEMIVANPMIDTKHVTDWLSMQPNKELLPAYQLDQHTKQRLQFTRFLIKRGTYNEGFIDADVPPHYRSLEDYTDDDMAQPEK